MFVSELKPKPGGDHKVSCEKVEGTDAVRRSAKRAVTREMKSVG